MDILMSLVWGKTWPSGIFFLFLIIIIITFFFRNFQTFPGDLVCDKVLKQVL